MLQDDILAVLFMYGLRNITNAVIGKSGIHSQTKLFSRLIFFWINYNTIIVQVRYINIEPKEVARIVHSGFLFRIRTQMNVLSSPQCSLILIVHCQILILDLLCQK